MCFPVAVLVLHTLRHRLLKVKLQLERLTTECTDDAILKALLYQARRHGGFGQTARSRM